MGNLNYTTGMAGVALFKCRVHCKHLDSYRTIVGGWQQPIADTISPNKTIQTFQLGAYLLAIVRYPDH